MYTINAQRSTRQPQGRGLVQILSGNGFRHENLEELVHLECTTHSPNRLETTYACLLDFLRYLASECHDESRDPAWRELPSPLVNQAN
jgi:hypothetical protein